MAKFVGLSSVNLDQLNFSVYLDSASPQYINENEVKLRDDAFVTITLGGEFSETATTPGVFDVEGTITSITDAPLDLFGNPSIDAGFTYSGFEIDLATFMNVARSSETTDDVALFQEMYKGNDQFKLSNGDDIMFGFAGNDKMNGNGGNDQLYGGAGKDKLNGGGGDDLLFGGEKNDKLNGAAGTDALTGGNGNDKLIGGGGNDVLFGDAGKDKLNGGKGNDQLFGGGGKDTFIFTGKGSQGDDFIFDFELGTDVLKMKGVEFVEYVFYEGFGEEAAVVYHEKGTVTLIGFTEENAFELESYLF